MQPKFFRNARDFERWLAANHRTARALLVGLCKVASGKPSITYSEALDAALAYGWIDGVRQRLDDDAYTIRFTARKQGSSWSAVNIRRAKGLIREGRMKPAGFAAFKGRDQERAQRLSGERQHAVLDAAVLPALKADRKAFAFFQALPPGLKRLYALWIASAKRDATRARRIALVIERCHAGKRIDPFHPFSRD